MKPIRVIEKFSDLDSYVKELGATYNSFYRQGTWFAEIKLPCGCRFSAVDVSLPIAVARLIGKVEISLSLDHQEVVQA